MYALSQLWPVPIAELQCFITYLYHKGYASKTVGTYMAAISFQHKLNGIADPAADFTVTKMLEGYRRLRPTSDPRTPISYDLLIRICDQLKHVCTSTFETTLFQAVYTLAFFGLFRVGELVFSAADQSDRPLYKSDLAVMSNNNTKALKVRIRKSKTNHSRAPDIIQVNEVRGPVCPVAAMTAYLTIRPSTSHYLFCHMNGVPLTRYQFGAVLSKTVQTLNLHSGHYRTHSFRIGAATWLAQNGVPYETIKRRGRWASDTFKRYIRI